jgi:hypothetical protein
MICGSVVYFAFKLRSLISQMINANLFSLGLVELVTTFFTTNITMSEIFKCERCKEEMTTEGVEKYFGLCTLCVTEEYPEHPGNSSEALAKIILSLTQKED